MMRRLSDWLDVHQAWSSQLMYFRDRIIRDIGPKARKRWINGNENGLDLDNERQ